MCLVESADIATTSLNMPLALVFYHALMDEVAMFHISYRDPDIYHLMARIMLPSPCFAPLLVCSGSYSLSMPCGRSSSLFFSSHILSMLFHSVIHFQLASRATHHLPCAGRFPPLWLRSSPSLCS